MKIEVFACLFFGLAMLEGNISIQAIHVSFLRFFVIFVILHLGKKN